MKRLLWLIVGAPVGIAVVVLAVSNRQPVTLALDPFAPESPALSVTLPLFVLLFAALFCGIVLGGIGAWLKQSRWRREARERRYEAARLRNEADRLKARNEAAAGPALPAPSKSKAA